MKKTLALLLAMLMIVSVALVSCKKKGNTDDTANTATSDSGFVVLDSDNSDEADDGTDDNNGVSNSGNSSSEFVDQVDTVYVLCVANLRENPKTSSKILTSIPFKTALQRTKINNKWSEVTYTPEGGTLLKGYVANDLITTNSNAVVFVDQGTAEAPIVTSIKADLGSGVANAKVREYPIANKYPNEYKVVTVEEDNAIVVGQIPKGTTNVTVVSISADGTWAYIKGNGTLKGANGAFDTAGAVEGYCLYSSLEISGATNSGSSGSNGIG